MITPEAAAPSSTEDGRGGEEPAALAGEGGSPLPGRLLGEGGVLRRVLLLMLSLLMVLPLSAAVDPFSLPVGTLIIDAGHGGHDPGASYNWPFAGGVVWERDLNLDIAKRLSVLVKLAHPQLRVIMTREDDTFISLAERSAIAASQSLDSKGALFVSIHINSAQAPSAQELRDSDQTAG